MGRARGRRATVLIIGAGGHGKVVCDALTAAGHRVVGWIDDNPRLCGRRVSGRQVLGPRRALPRLLRRLGRVRPGFIVAIGDNARRRTVFKELLRLGLRPVSAIHPSAVVAPSARMGAGVVVCGGAVINPDATIGDNVIINTGASVDHDNRIGPDAHLSPGVHTGGRVRIGRGAHVGLGAVILPDRHIGAYAVVGAGAVVDLDVAERVVAVGVPARPVRRLG